METNITRSQRKSISLKIDRNGVVQVRAPLFVSKKYIQDFVQKNKDWIEKQKNKIQEQKNNQKYYLLGEELSVASLPLEGKEFKIGVSGGEKGGCKIYLEKFYKSEAKKYIPKRCRELAQKYGFRYKNIRITSAKTRWGSCSSEKNLNFSYRLIMTPKICIDYVIIHELCHLRQMNHSPKFWNEVANIMPNYKIQEDHLKKNSLKYSL